VARQSSFFISSSTLLAFWFWCSSAGILPPIKVGLLSPHPPALLHHFPSRLSHSPIAIFPYPSFTILVQAFRDFSIHLYRLIHLYWLSISSPVHGGSRLLTSQFSLLVPLRAAEAKTQPNPQFDELNFTQFFLYMCKVESSFGGLLVYFVKTIKFYKNY